MIDRIRGKLSFANVTSMMALTIALGGTSYAAATLPHNSVGSSQIKSKAVHNSDLASNAVTSGKVKNGALLAQDFKAGQLPAGATGATGAPGAPGAPGATGPQGPAGLLGSTIVRRTDIALPAGAGVGVPGAEVSAFATCGTGQKIVGGSANISNPPDSEVTISRPSVDNVGVGAVPVDGASYAFWKGTGRTLTNVAATLRVFAICATP
ncbi:MAG: hypothetical protein QOE31_1615 [Solirubrobacteraceae bacterium]|jgi:hypothetical protein|nr:hypothetical protein [Solirubrobacteraceae bacterium]